ncbi:MAG: hypothetical protein WCD18_21215 [Thermosynechococcaceae cyanobacterium]
MNSTTYSDPVSKLFSFGNCREMDSRNWPDYPAELGLTSVNEPELIRMATDLSFWEKEGIEVWAPVHAWRSLGQLRSVAAIKPLMQLFVDRENEWAIEELPLVYGMIGPQAIPDLSEYLLNAANEAWPRATAVNCLEKIVEAYPEYRDACISPITEALGNFADNESFFNALLICPLLDWQVVEAAPLMEQAFTSKNVDEMVVGTWASVQVELGLKQKKDFAPEAFQLPINPEIQKWGKLLDLWESQSKEPLGFGGPGQTKGKKGKQKKKKK